ncbi:MAG: HEAT repeat domain-containing protein [Planctomycetaceae bacterium]
MLLEMGEKPDEVVAVIEKKFDERDEDDFFANGKMAALLLKASPENAKIGAWFEEQVRHEDKYHRLGALSAMSYAGDAGKPSLPIINRRLHDESPAVRVAAASAVWRIEGDAVTAVPILLATLDVEGETYRNRPSGISEWLPDHRIVAVGALGEITKHKKEIAQALLPLLNDDDELVQFMTLRSLARLNERGPGIVEAVRKKTNSQESLVANEANETLKRITADEPR